MNDDILKLDNQICFALYASSREIIKLYKPALDKLGITYTQYVTLLSLWEQDDITVKDLGNKLYLDSGTLTPLLKKLESMNIIERLRSKEDERVVYIKLTQKGIEMKEKALEIPKQVFCSTGLSIENAIELKNNLKQLLSNLNTNR